MDEIPSWEANSNSASQIHRLYEAWSFITVFATAHHWSLSWSRWI